MLFLWVFISSSNFSAVSQGIFYFEFKSPNQSLHISTEQLKKGASHSYWELKDINLGINQCGFFNKLTREMSNKLIKLKP